MSAEYESGKESLFPSTEWTSLLKPIREQSYEAEAALERLCTAYQRPIHGYLRWRGYDHHTAEEIVQDFIVSLIHQGTLRRLRRENGRFRSFLLVCLRNFLSKRRQHDQSQKRGGGALPLPLDESIAEGATDPESTMLEFDRHWARHLLEAALEHVRSDYQMSGRRPRFEDLEGYLTGDEGKTSRKALADRLGVTSGYLDVSIHRLRRSYGVAVRAMVSRTVESPEEIQDELHYLMRILGSSHAPTCFSE